MQITDTEIKIRLNENVEVISKYKCRWRGKKYLRTHHLTSNISNYTTIVWKRDDIMYGPLAYYYNSIPDAWLRVDSGSSVRKIENVTIESKFKEACLCLWKTR